MRVISLFAILLVIIAVVSVNARGLYEPYPTEAFGTVPMGKYGNSTMFYELQGDPSKTASERSRLPLMIWCSGGPGSSSQLPSLIENIGNTRLIVDPNNSSTYATQPNEYAWTKFANVIFPDSPLGTGWSTAAVQEDFSTTDDGLAQNLVLLMKGFLKNHPEFKQSEFWIWGESYSGKIVNNFAVAILNSDLNNDIKLMGVSNDDGWTSPISCMKSYGPFMRANSLCNEKQATYLNQLATQAEQQLAAGNGNAATNLWGIQQQAYDEMANGVNVYNIRYYYTYFPEQFVGPYENEVLRKKFPVGLIPESKSFNDQDGQVFTAMGNAFMKDALNEVETLLNAGLSVNVWSGQLDLIVDTLCTQMWIERLNWKGLPKFQEASRKGFILNASSDKPFNNGYLQQYENFRFFQVVDGGHLSPHDQKVTASYIAKYIVTNGAGVDKTPFEDAEKLKQKRLSELKQRRRRGV